MPLARHVDADDIINRVKPTSVTEEGGPSVPSRASQHLTPYASRYAAQKDIPKYKLPEEGAPADTVYTMLTGELDLDGRPTLNVASFVNTFLEDNARQLMIDNLSKNFADADEYPALMSIHERCVSIIANLWGAQPPEKAVGTATVGSSEGVLLGGLAMKRRWQEKRRAQGKDTSKPNIIMGMNAQVALEKFARYFDVEARKLPVSAKSQYRLDPELVRENIDENTIGVFAILGSTYTGHYEPVEEISKILDEYQEKTGIDIPIHVDAAGGGFVAPFTYAGVGDLGKWNFELPRVKSINASGHKYGLTYVGVGWVIWRDQAYLPEDLVFELHYLGGTEHSFTLNFSRPGAQVAVQYYQLVHLGFNGYREIMENCLANARLLARALEATGWYTCVSGVHHPVSGLSSVAGVVKQTAGQEDSSNYQPGLPIASFRLSDDFTREYPDVTAESVSLLMRARQWIIPHYALPPNEEKTGILRVAVRESMSFDLLDRLITDIVDVTQRLMENANPGLDVITKQKRTLHLKSEEGKRKVEEEERKKNRMDEGIHRSVC